ncbi:hypothetical protein B0T18DRAFT_247810 [Schizothecium vesticola]|uniref:Uncharacterized protein n=1 Tax=Schizothecium vesticola TaxID=314040 RepID=A0AA40BQH3_9PEZI|nr:hypothetical protein B0T18DRAFT_247810 [Schizothecium vesticola]
MGLSRPSISFQGRSLVNCPTAVTKEGLWPMRQLANLCHMAKTRYGYIMTDEDLVVCRFYYPEDGMNQVNRLKVEIMAVPWTVHGEAQLTTDLALWWLCMLALSPTQHCAMTTKDDMVGIDEWEVRYLNDEHGWVRRHRCSDVEQPVDPPPYPASQTPSLGNQAAFDINPNNNLPLPPNNNFYFHFHLGNNQAPVQGGELNNDLGLWDASPPPADGEDPNNWHAANNEGLAGGAQRRCGQACRVPWGTRSLVAGGATGSRVWPAAVPACPWFASSSCTVSGRHM